MHLMFQTKTNLFLLLNNSIVKSENLHDDISRIQTFTWHELSFLEIDIDYR